MSTHDNKKLAMRERIKDSTVIFIDQFGKFHKVWNDEYDKIFTELPYHIPTGKPKPINMRYKHTDPNIMKLLKECWIPDISIIRNGLYTYWIELVNTNSCDEKKHEYIQTLDFPAIEFSVHDYDHRKKRRVVPCFDLTKVSKKEYEIIRKYYKVRHKYDGLYDDLISLFMGTSKDKFRALSYLIEEYNGVPKDSNAKEVNIKTQSNDKKIVNSITFENHCFETIINVMDIATPKLKEGASICYNSLLNRCIELSESKEEISKKLDGMIRRKLRKEYNVSIYNFENESYLDATIEHFKLKRRLSILNRELADNVLKFNYDLKK